MSTDHSATVDNAALKRGLPSLTVFLLILLPVLLQPFIRGGRSQRYRDLVIKAAEKNDFETAGLFLSKAMSLNTQSDPELQFVQAEIASRQGQIDSARSTMESLTKATSNVSAEAHLWLATHMLHETRFSESQSDSNKAVIDHLQAAIDSDNTSATAMDAHLMMGWMLLKTDALSARRHLESAIAHRPEADFLLGEACEKTGDRNQAAVHFADARRRLTRELTADSQNPKKITQLAAACRKLGNFLQAEQIMQAAIRKSADRRSEYQLRKDLAEAWIEQARQIGFSERASQISRLRALILVGRALDMCPESRVVLSVFTEKILKDSITNNVRFLQTQAADHFLTSLVAGIELMQSGSEADAEERLRKASETMKRFPALLDRLVWFLLDESDVATAERLCRQIDRLYAQSPDRKFFCPVLGRMELMRGNLEPAIAELRKAVEFSPDDAEVAALLEQAVSALEATEKNDK